MDSGTGEPSGCLDDTSVKHSLTRKRDTTQYNTANLEQTWQNMAAPMHRDTAREKAVNIVKLYCLLLTKSIIPAASPSRMCVWCAAYVYTCTGLSDFVICGVSTLVGQIPR